MSGWRNSNWSEDVDAPLAGAWLVGLAILAVLSIVAFVLIGIGLVLG